MNNIFALGKREGRDEGWGGGFLPSQLSGVSPNVVSTMIAAEKWSIFLMFTAFF